MRLGTASLLSEAGGPFINVERLDLRKYAARPLLVRPTPASPRMGMGMGMCMGVRLQWAQGPGA